MKPAAHYMCRNRCAFQRMIGTSCGQRMPVPETTYFDRVPEELATIRTWIQNGAPDN